MRKPAPLRLAGSVALLLLGSAVATGQGTASSENCVDCLTVRVGPPIVVRGPFPDELDAPFTALRLADGSFRGFSANATTYAIDGATLWDMGGERQPLFHEGEPGSINDCGSWLTSTVRDSDTVLGFVHQEGACDYNEGRTDKSMAMARSLDEGLTWTDLGTVITGPDDPQRARITGEGDCTMIDGRDGYLYGYCLRNSDWQTIVARAPINEPAEWKKYFEGAWNEPGLDGRASDVGFIGPGVGYFEDFGAVAAISVDAWFGGLRLSLSEDKVSFVDLKEPLVNLDETEWQRPAQTELMAYANIINPANGSSAVKSRFLLTYIYVPPGEGFESRYLVFHEVALAVGRQPEPVQVGMALTRWVEPARKRYVTSSGPMTGERDNYLQDRLVAYMLTRAPDGVASVKIAECSSQSAGYLDQVLAQDGSCESGGYTRDRTGGWLFADQQLNSVPVYRCVNDEAKTHFASSAEDCEGLGRMEFLLGYGLAP